MSEEKESEGQTLDRPLSDLSVSLISTGGTEG